MGIRRATFTLLLMGLLASPASWAQEFAWAGRMGGTDIDVAADVAVDSGGNVYTVGQILGTADFDPGPGTFELTSAGNWDVFVSKLDGTGSFVWAKLLGGTDFDYSGGVAVDGAGNVYTTGLFVGTSDFDPGHGTLQLTASTGSDVFVSKLDQSGNFVWARQIAVSGGGNWSFGVAVDGAGSVYTVGYFNGVADFDPGPATFNLTAAGDYDVFVSKLDGAGNFVWARRLGGTALDEPSSIALDPGGGVYTAGYYHGMADFNPGTGTLYLNSAGGQDAFVSKLDSAGNFVWAKRLGGALDDEVQDVALDSSGNVVTVGLFEGTADFDPGPGTFPLTATGGANAFLSKLDGAGNFVWARQLGGPVVALGVAVDGAGSVHVAGQFFGTIDFDPGPASFALTSAGSWDSFVLKLDGAGNFVWARGAGGASSDAARDVALDGSGNVVAVGSFRVTADFDPGPGSFDLTAAGLGDAFATKLRRCGDLVGPSGYGTLLFTPLCTSDAAGLPQSVYNSVSLSRHRGAGDRLFLSSRGDAFAPLVVDDAVHVNGLESGLGPYGYQPGVPPFIMDVSIENNLVPLPAHEINTHLIPEGQGTVFFELVDTQSEIYGNAAVYLVQDCGIWLAGRAPTAINWMTHDNQVEGRIPEFEVRYGFLSHLRADRDFSRASCLGSFSGTPAADTLPDPPAGDGYYYLARGLSSCVAQGYGNSSLVPDPRDALDALPPCP